MVVQLKTLFRSLANAGALLVGTAAGIAQLVGIGKGWSQVILTAVGVICLFFLAIRWWLLFYDAEIKKLEESLTACRAEVAAARREIEVHRSQLATLQIGHSRYDEAIHHVVEQSDSSYRESLEITVTIGVDNDGDTVTERRRTMPAPRVTHRNMRPIIPTADAARPLGTGDIALQTRVTDGNTQITPLPLVNQMPLRVWLVFRPSLSRPTDWEIEYRPRGLWAPLRKTGTDKLTWQDRPPIGKGVRSVLDELVVKFVFPRGIGEPSVTERFNMGQITGPTPSDGGGWLIEFRDTEPAGRHYVWDLAQRPVPEVAQPPVQRPAETTQPSARDEVRGWMRD